MMKIHEAYSALKEHSEKRELLEKSARAKLQSEVLNLTESNKDMKERHEAIMAQVSDYVVSFAYILLYPADNDTFLSEEEHNDLLMIQ